MNDMENKKAITINWKLYFENYKAFGEAIVKAGGHPFIILDGHDDFLTTLANNGIKVACTIDVEPEVNTPYLDELLSGIKKQ